MSEKSACNSPRNRLPIDFKFQGYITRIHKVQFDPFNEMFLMIFISVDWIMQIGTGKGHEKLGTLGRFFGAPNDGHEQKRAQPHALDPCECVWVDFNIAKAITVKLWGQKSWKVAFFRMTQELKIWPSTYGRTDSPYSTGLGLLRFPPEPLPKKVIQGWLPPRGW